MSKTDRSGLIALHRRQPSAPSRNTETRGPVSPRSAVPAHETVFVTRQERGRDTFAVLHPHGTAAPRVTVTQISEHVLTIHANGAPLAVLASAQSNVTAAEILRIERSADGTVPVPSATSQPHQEAGPITITTVKSGA